MQLEVQGFSGGSAAGGLKKQGPSGSGHTPGKGQEKASSMGSPRKGLPVRETPRCPCLRCSGSPSSALGLCGPPRLGEGPPITAEWRWMFRVPQASATATLAGRGRVLHFMSPHGLHWDHRGQVARQCWRSSASSHLTSPYIFPMGRGEGPHYYLPGM